MKRRDLREALFPRLSRREVLGLTSMLTLLVCAVYASAFALDGHWLAALPFAAAVVSLAFVVRSVMKGVDQ